VQDIGSIVVCPLLSAIVVCPLLSVMRRISARGHEIGLHPSYKTFQEPELLRQEANRLRKICDEEGIEQSLWGGRMHYLRWEQPTTLRAWADAGMNYDSTMGYADRPGFRCGTCFEYPAFDPVTMESLDLRVRPLIAMDATILSPQYLGLEKIEAIEKIKYLKYLCEELGGQFVLLWHNSQFLFEEDKEMYFELFE